MLTHLPFHFRPIRSPHQPPVLKENEVSVQGKYPIQMKSLPEFNDVNLPPRPYKLWRSICYFWDSHWKYLIIRLSSRRLLIKTIFLCFTGRSQKAAISREYGITPDWWWRSLNIQPWFQKLRFSFITLRGHQLPYWSLSDKRLLSWARHAI